MILAAIDPGLRACGLAVFKDAVLIEAQLVPGSVDALDHHAWRAMGLSMARALTYHAATPGEERRLVIEFPQIYEARAHSKGPAEDLLQVASVVAAITTNTTWTCRLFRPAQWKGQKPKPPMEALTRTRITPFELSKIQLPAKSLAHNVWDAVAMGLWYLDREGLRAATFPQFTPPT